MTIFSEGSPRLLDGDHRLNDRFLGTVHGVGQAGLAGADITGYVAAAQGDSAFLKFPRSDQELAASDQYLP